MVYLGARMLIVLLLSSMGVPVGCENLGVNIGGGLGRLFFFNIYTISKENYFVSMSPSSPLTFRHLSLISSPSGVNTFSMCSAVLQLLTQHIPILHENPLKISNNFVSVVNKNLII